LSLSGCDTMQGYFFSHALTPSAAEAYLVRSDLRKSGGAEVADAALMAGRFGHSMGNGLAAMH